MISAAELERARAEYETAMVDTCTIGRGTGIPVFNPATGSYEPSSTPVYTGKCRLQSVRAQANNPEAGGAEFTVERLELQLPFGTVFEIGDIATYASSQFNPALVGNEYRITGLGEKTHATAQRFNVEVVE